MTDQREYPNFNYWWKYTPRGGHGYTYLVPCRVVKFNPRSVTIVALKSDNRTVVQRNVNKNNLIWRSFNFGQGPIDPATPTLSFSTYYSARPYPGMDWKG